MELQNTGNYKFYKCRSSLNSFSGGTVYDTSAVCNISPYTKSILKNSDGRVNLIKIENKSLVDLNTHIDDDEFNNYNQEINVADDFDCKIIKYVINVENLQNPNYYSSQTDKVNTQESMYLNLNDSNTVTSQESQHYSIVGSNIIALTKDNCSENNNSTKDTSYCQEDNLQYSSSYLTIPDSISSTDISIQENSDSSFCSSSIITTSVPASTKMNVHKRKQTYIIKDDSFFTLPFEEQDNLPKISLSSRSKKKKLAKNKENQEQESFYMSTNSFGQVKMNSILKSNKPVINEDKNLCSQKIDYIKEENSSFNSSHVNEKIIYKKVSMLSNNYYINFNSEFTNPDYFEHIQPREKIIESNIDKLLSPTLEVEFFPIFKTCPEIAKQEKLVDYNRNEIYFQDYFSSEAVRREYALKSKIAKQCGYENIFKTPNDWIISEILFSDKKTYQNVELDLLFVNDTKTILKQEENSSNSFKPVSLEESLNDLKLFGGLTDESRTEKSSDDDYPLIIDESHTYFENNRILKKKKIKSKIAHSEKKSKYKKDPLALSNIDYNKDNSKKVNFVEIKSDNYSAECVSNTESDVTNLPGSIKIKIKRVNEEKNQYVIDTPNNKKIVNIADTNGNTKLRDLYKYECSYCHEKVRTKRLLNSHESQYHKGPYDTECNICHVQFKKSSAHKKHQRWCEKFKKYVCYICDKEYCYNASLIKHLKTHSTNFIPMLIKIEEDETA